MKIQDRSFESELVFKSSRSGGKGGQNVNKVETKIQLNFNVLNSILLNDDEKKKILINLQNKIDKSGTLKITSQSERTQYLNKQNASIKFYGLIEKAFEEESIRKKTKPSSGSKELRIEEKKKISEKKRMRKIGTDDYFD